MRYLLLLLMVFLISPAEARHRHYHRHHTRVIHHSTVPIPRERVEPTTVFDVGYYSYKNFTSWDHFMPTQERMWSNPCPVIADIKPAVVKASYKPASGMTTEGSFILLFGCICLALGALWPPDRWPFCVGRHRDRSHKHTQRGVLCSRLKSLLTNVPVMKLISTSYLRIQTGWRLFNPYVLCIRMYSRLSLLLWKKRRRMLP